jgi:hypothetical protein
MAKVQKISEISPNIPFTEYNFYDFYKKSFRSTELGRMHELIPFKQLAEDFGLRRHNRHMCGRKPFFTPEGKIALAFLMMYTKLSAPMLMEQLNANIHYQIFCGIRIHPAKPLTDYKVIDKIMSELSLSLKIQTVQTTLAEAWKPYMENVDTFLTDATCYESRMRFPTDAKLLWECIEKSYHTMCEISKALGIHRPRTKYLDVSSANMAYVKQRRHSHTQTRKLIRRELNLLGKILEEIRRMQREHEDSEVWGDIDFSDIAIITRICRQQNKHFKSDDTRESIPDRIVSVRKPYIRPIVRGKENKNVEFGSKCNNIQVDGVSFIEKISFSPFNEGTRLKHCITLHRRLFGVDAKYLAGDNSYSGNKNRELCREKHIETNFAQKGRKLPEDDERRQIRKELARVRATAMEGSFGTQKEHYSLRKVQAMTRKTEILYIFFGIHAANLVTLAGRLSEKQVEEAV